VDFCVGDNQIKALWNSSSQGSSKNAQQYHCEVLLNQIVVELRLEYDDPIVVRVQSQGATGTSQWT
jgi:hypothetical protein